MRIGWEQRADVFAVTIPKTAHFLVGVVSVVIEVAFQVFPALAHGRLIVPYVSFTINNLLNLDQFANKLTGL